MALLTKSKYMVGLSCPKYLWMMFHDLDKIPEKDMAAAYFIQQGHIVGQLAKKLFPDGIDVQEGDFKQNLLETNQFYRPLHRHPCPFSQDLFLALFQFYHQQKFSLVLFR